MSIAVSQHKNYVGGEWVDSAGGETMPVLNPATGETIAEVPASTEEDANRAVEAARDALAEWLDTTPRERSEMLLKLADVIDENADELAALESRNVGKPIAAAAGRARRDGGQPSLLRRRRAHPRRSVDRRVHARAHLLDSP